MTAPKGLPVNGGTGESERGEMEPRRRDSIKVKACDQRRKEDKAQVAGG